MLFYSGGAGFELGESKSNPAEGIVPTIPVGLGTHLGTTLLCPVISCWERARLMSSFFETSSRLDVVR